MKIETLEEAITAIKEEIISYGEEGDYYFIVDEDGILFFLKRDSLVLDDEGEKREGWSQYCDDVILSIDTNESRGTEITRLLFEAFKIKIGG